MKATVQTWGNSLALRIPKGIAEEIHVKAGSAVDLRVDPAGELMVKPAKEQKRYNLTELISKVSKKNIHAQIEWGKPQGKEVW